ncbi:hypothetical protein ACVMFA_003249 [Bradyrhizobium liaoningense]
MAGLVPAIHVLGTTRVAFVDGRDKPGHDDPFLGVQLGLNSRHDLI